jgi:uncharacterized membrane protein
MGRVRFLITFLVLLASVLPVRHARSAAALERGAAIIDPGALRELDRGIDAKVGRAGWEKICKAMETDFKAGNFAGGVVRGIEAVSSQLAAHFPRTGGGRNELPDAPVVM